MSIFIVLILGLINYNYPGLLVPKKTIKCFFLSFSFNNIFDNLLYYPSFFPLPGLDWICPVSSINSED